MTRAVTPALRRWVDRISVATFLLADSLIGFVWLVGGDQRASASAYDHALEFLPVETYGAALLLLTAGVFVLWAWTEEATTLAWAGLAAFWAWWCALTAITALQRDDVSAYFPATAAVLAVVHFGTALTREG